jgi:hypothetical protein
MGLSTLSTTSFSVKMVTLPVSISTLASTCWFWDAFTALRYAEAMQVPARAGSLAGQTLLFQYFIKSQSKFVLHPYLTPCSLCPRYAEKWGRPLFGVCDIAYSTHCILHKPGQNQGFKEEIPPRLVIE